MLLKNLEVTKGLVNGARGRVDGFTKEGNPLVVFMSGSKHEVGNRSRSRRPVYEEKIGSAAGYRRQEQKQGSGDRSRRYEMGS